MHVVTGASGFLGSYVVCALLRQGQKVRALKRADSDPAEFEMIAGLELGEDKDRLLQNLVWDTADLTEILELDRCFEGADTVFHCAARVAFDGNRAALLKVNAEGTAHVVNACLHAGVRKLVYASSTAALGRTDAQGLISETSEWTDDQNNTVYAESKHLAELEVWRGMEEGLEAVIVNPGIILGAGLWSKGSCRLFDRVYHGLRFYTRGVNGFVGVRDVAATMLSLGFSDIRNERFVLVAENMSYARLFSLMAESLSVREPSVELRPSVLKWFGWILRIRSLFFPASQLSAETLKTALKQHLYDNSKWKATGYEPAPLSAVIEESARVYLSGTAKV